MKCTKLSQTLQPNWTSPQTTVAETPADSTMPAANFHFYSVLRVCSPVVAYLKTAAKAQQGIMYMHGNSLSGCLRKALLHRKGVPWKHLLLSVNDELPVAQSTSACSVFSQDGVIVHALQRRFLQRFE